MYRGDGLVRYGDTGDMADTGDTGDTWKLVYEAQAAQGHWDMRHRRHMDTGI